MVTSIEVAKHAGVSQATVSRVLNGYPGIRKETKEKVLKAMEELNYRPNLIARSLVMNQTRNIALISGTLKNQFFVEATDVIVRTAAEKGFNTMVYFENKGDNQHLFNQIISHKPDGIILSSILLDDPVFKDLENSGIPYMMFNRRPRNGGGNYVVMDNLLAGEMITEYLIELGHERIAFISGHINVSTYYERKKGYEQALRKHNLNWDEQLIPITDATPEEVIEATHQLMNLQTPPTAIICATDAMALTCINVLQGMSLKIPDDISLCGIDNIEMSAHSSIRLTTIGQYKYRLGELAIQHLMELIEAGKDFTSKRQTILQPELIVRDTTRLLR